MGPGEGCLLITMSRTVGVEGEIEGDWMVGHERESSPSHHSPKVEGQI